MDSRNMGHGKFFYARTSIKRKHVLKYNLETNPPKETIEKETATWGSRSFYENLKKIEERKIIPSILFKNDTIRADSPEAKAVYKVAARIRDQLEID